MSDLNVILDIAEKLDKNGFNKEAAVLDDLVDSITKTAKQGIHKCGLKESTVSDHKKLLENYKKAVKHLNEEYAKAMKSGNEKDSSNYGKLRDIASSYAHNCNAVALHEIYMSDVIDNNPYSINKDSQMLDLLKQLYGDYSTFTRELERLVLIPKNGWVVFSYCTINKELIFNIIDLHDQNVLLSTIPVLAIDMWEHAYISDFGLNKDEYVKWFLNRVDWRNIRKRIKSIRLK